MAAAKAKVDAARIIKLEADLKKATVAKAQDSQRAKDDAARVKKLKEDLEKASSSHKAKLEALKKQVSALQAKSGGGKNSKKKADKKALIVKKVSKTPASLFRLRLSVPCVPRSGRLAWRNNFSPPPVKATPWGQIKWKMGNNKKVSSPQECKSAALCRKKCKNRPE